MKGLFHHQNLKLKCLERQRKASLQERRLNRHLSAFSLKSAVLRPLLKYRFTMPYTTLSKAQKRLLLAKVKSPKRLNHPFTCRVLASWFQEKFELSTTPSTCTIARTVRELDTKPEVNSKRICKRCRNHEGDNPKLVAALFSWIRNPAALCRMIKNPKTQRKGAFLLYIYNASFQVNEQILLKFNDGWIKILNAGRG